MVNVCVEGLLINPFLVTYSGHWGESAKNSQPELDPTVSLMTQGSFQNEFGPGAGILQDFSYQGMFSKYGLKTC